MSTIPPPATRRVRLTPGIEAEEHHPTTERLPAMEHRRERKTEPPVTTIRIVRSHGHTYWLLLCVLLGALIVLILMGIWQNTYDQWNYGNGRISRIEARFGHHDRQSPTVVLALDAHGQIDVIELPGGDAKAARTYHLGDIVSQQRAPIVITLQVTDINGDGRSDLLVSPENSAAPFVLYNNGSSFQTIPPSQA
jgi:hypothetical protein